MSKIEDLPVKYDYTGNGATKRFQFNSMFWNISDIVVYVNGVHITSGYDVESTSNDSATIVFETAPENDDKITLYRNLTAARLTEYTESGTFRADPTNDEFNHILGLIQQNREALGRCPQLGVESVKVDLTIEDPQAGHAIVWDSEGKKLKNSKYVFDAAVDEVREKTNLAINAASLATQKATDAAVSETNASNSATAAAGSATAAATSATAAQEAKEYAEAAITDENLIAVATDLDDDNSYIKAAGPNATAAAGSATAAATSATAAAGSASVAAASATAAERAATAAAGSAIAAASSETAAGISELNSATAAGSAIAAKTAAATSETNASNSATAAAGSATAAATSATAAAGSATAAATSATAAEGSATAAATSATAAAGSESVAQQWAIGVPGEPTGGSAKYWAERAEDAASGVQNPANTALSNLSADGQMIIDSQNGTISNCILEIPQNLKLTLENNVLTLKAGSILTLANGSTYTTSTTNTDNTTTISNTRPNGVYIITVSSNGVFWDSNINIIHSHSGSTAPENPVTHELWYNTTDQCLYNWSSLSNSWQMQSLSYPICLIEVKSGVASFAKDSNGNDMIFNGIGFIGHHVFEFPNIKGLRGIGINSDGSLASEVVSTDALYITEMATGVAYTGYPRVIGLMTNNTSGFNNWRAYKEVNTYDELEHNLYMRQYVRSDNLIYIDMGGRYSPNQVQCQGTPLVDYLYDGTTVTYFTIRQPVRTATVEMVDKVQVQVDTNTTAISGKQDTLVSGTNIKTINSTPVLGSGNFTLADQSLSNLSSDGQMIVDSANATISNCILEIPQNLKLTLENNVLTVKAGSYITECGSTYALDTVANDISRTFGALPDGKYYIFSVPTGIQIQRHITEVTSGTEPPATGTNTSLFFDTTDKSLYAYDTSTNTWVLWANRQFYPICILEFNSGVASFAKDSNGNDMIFNGWCYMGGENGTTATFVVYPNVKMLRSDGIDSNNKLKSKVYTNNSLYIVSRTSAFNNLCIGITDNSLHLDVYGGEYKYLSDITSPGSSTFYYITSENLYYRYTDHFTLIGTMPFIYFNKKSTGIEILKVSQPVRTATVEMVDKKQDVLTFDSTPTQNSSNPVTSSGIYMALNDKQNTLTFDSAPTQNSTNPVTSGGIYNVLGDIESLINAL